MLHIVLGVAVMDWPGLNTLLATEGRQIKSVFFIFLGSQLSDARDVFDGELIRPETIMFERSNLV